MSDWYTIKNDELSECLRCKHTSYEHAENDAYVYKNGEHEVFCPECHSDYYFLREG